MSVECTGIIHPVISDGKRAPHLCLRKLKRPRHQSGQGQRAQHRDQTLRLHPQNNANRTIPGKHPRETAESIAFVQMIDVETQIIESCSEVMTINL